MTQRAQLPVGTYLVWSGQFEYLERAEARLQVIVPLTLMIIFLLLYLTFRRFTETLIVLLSLPFSLIGGLWLLWWLGFNLSVAVAIAGQPDIVLVVDRNAVLAAARAAIAVAAPLGRARRALDMR